MKAVLFFFLIAVGVIGCNDKNETSPAAVAAVQEKTDTAPNFFPVTSFLRGQLFEIKNGGITPIRRTKAGSDSDSSWVKMDSLESLFKAFLSPVIDTANLKDSFIEKKFLDQTLNAFTFTYDPIPGIKNDFPFRHWDVYVDAETNKVTRIYLVKTIDDNNQMQLTWLSGKWCKIVKLTNMKTHPQVEKEEKTSWSYEN